MNYVYNALDLPNMSFLNTYIYCLLFDCVIVLAILLAYTLELVT